jgi:glycosyltransferase involved in cell wall biosynthesis
MLISVIIPCYNEAPVIRETYRRLGETLSGVANAEYELIFIDNGSTDGTREIMAELQAGDARVRALLLSRNFGHQMSVTAGLENAAGDVLVIIDADLQDPPEVILEMLEHWRAGYQVAYGTRIEREGETRFKLWTAKLFYRLMNRLSETQIPLDTGDFRLIDRQVADALLRMPESHRFLRGMVSWVGFKQIAVPYKRAPRLAGESKYPLFDLIRFAADGVVSFSFVPLRLAIWFGFLSICFAFVGIVFALVYRLFGSNTDAHFVRGWASLFVAILFLGGVQLVFLGVIGEYLGRIYTEVKRRPLYVVQERLGFPGPAGSKPNR